MIGWHHRLEQLLGDGERQGRLECCSPWGDKESDMTWQLKNNNYTYTRTHAYICIYAGSIPAWEDPLEEGMATHSSILAWRIPQTEEPVGYSPYGLKEPDTTEATCPHTHVCREESVDL